MASPPPTPSIAQLGQQALGLHQAGQLGQAEALYRQILARSPGHREALHLLGLVCHQRGDNDQALTLIGQAVRSGGSAPMYSNLGHVLMALGRAHEAVDCFRQACALAPAFPEAWHNQGVALVQTGQLQPAIDCYRRSLALAPGQADCHSNLLLALLYSSRHTAEQVLAEHRRFAEVFEQPLRASWPVHGHLRDPDRRLKIGYLSADLRMHSIAFFIEPVLAAHDRDSFDIHCYHSHPIHDAVSDRLQALADHWTPCADWTDAQLAQRIRADGIDLLIDLSGHTAGNRLLVMARKPAPVQFTWMGAPGTTGLSAVDYRLTDADLDPPGLTEAWHTETLIRLDGVPYAPPASSPDVGPLPSLGGAPFTFACLNNLIKINDDVIRVWAEILRAVPGSRILLGHVNDEFTRQRLATAFSEVGVQADRLLLHPALPLGDYLALHRTIDLALDPFPYNGGTSSCHSLWMGVPVVTLAGAGTPSRVGAALLGRVGLDALVANNEADYIRLAIALAGDRDRLATLRATLRERLRQAGGADSVSLTRQLESALRSCWRRWCVQDDLQ